MAYVPPKKQKHGKWIAIIAVVIAIVFGVLWGYQSFHPQTPAEEKPFTVCGWNEQETAERLKRNAAEDYAISDYLYYGESLNLFAKDYEPGKDDDVRRKSITLSDVCTGENVIYTMEDTADRQIDLRELKPGFYALSILDDFTEKRLVYDEQIEAEPFYTVARDGKVKRVTLLGDKDLVTPALTQNDLFLQVEECKPQSAVYDVFIDPYGARKVNGVVQDSGSANGLAESQEMQWAAEQLKAELEKHGLTVLLAKDDADEALGYYGSAGIMQKAYAAKAKYYLELGMNASSQAADRGMEIYYSHYASPTLANTLMYELTKHTSLIGSELNTWTERYSGVSADYTIVGNDGQESYDRLPCLRESGGRISGAGRFSAAAQENAAVVQASRAGMQALSINFIYITNQADAQIWKKERETIVTELSNALVKAIHADEPTQGKDDDHALSDS